MNRFLFAGAATMLTMGLSLDQASASETFRAGVEPLPPFIESQNAGLSITFLRELAKKAGVTLTIEQAPYNRLKEGIKEGRYDIIGHTPAGGEEKAFYAYAQDLDWKLPTSSDIYTADQNKLKDLSKIKIGTPRGNIPLAAELTGLKAEQFVDDGNIESLVERVALGRLDAFWFARASAFPAFRKTGKTIYYKSAPVGGVPVAFSLSKTKTGNELKQKLEAALKTMDWQKFFKNALELEALPSEGVVK